MENQNLTEPTDQSPPPPTHLPLLEFAIGFLTVAFMISITVAPNFLLTGDAAIYGVGFAAIVSVLGASHFGSNWWSTNRPRAFGLITAICFLIVPIAVMFIALLLGFGLSGVRG